jgi:hypothetical protein
MRGREAGVRRFDGGDRLHFKRKDAEVRKDRKEAEIWELRGNSKVLGWGDLRKSNLCVCGVGRPAPNEC